MHTICAFGSLEPKLCPEDPERDGDLSVRMKMPAPGQVQKTRTATHSDPPEEIGESRSDSLPTEVTAVRAPRSDPSHRCEGAPAHGGLT